MYDLVERGGLDVTHAALYRRPLGALKRAGLIALEGRQYVPLHPTARATVAPSSPPPAPRASVRAPAPEPMITVVAKVPRHIVDELDSIGPNRSEAIRTALDVALRPLARAV